MRTLFRSLVIGGCSVLSMGDALAWAQQPAISAQNPAQNVPPAWAAQAPLIWHNNLDTALKAAAPQRKFILVHFWNDNCPPCVGVERNVFSRPEVQQAIGASFIPVKIKVDDQPDLAKKYRVDRWPMDIVLSADGQELYRAVSSQNPGQYVAVLGRVAATARGATSVVQDATRSASSWADRMAGSIPTFGETGSASQAAANPAANAPAAASFAANSGPPPADAYARSSFQPAPGDRFQPPVTMPPQIDRGVAAGPGVVNERGYGATPATATSVDASRFSPPAGQTPASAFVPPDAPRQEDAVQRGFPPSAPAPAASPGANAFGAAPPSASSYSIPLAGNPNSPPVPAASDAAPVGLEGFCPVTLFDTRKWRRADVRWGVVHRDRTYLFAGPDEQRRFLENPDRYAPMLSGYDPVRYVEQGQLVDGRRQHGVWFRNQMFLFADEGSLERFWKNPDVVVPRVEQAMRATAGDGMLRR